MWYMDFIITMQEIKSELNHYILIIYQQLVCLFWNVFWPGIRLCSIKTSWNSLFIQVKQLGGPFTFWWTGTFKSRVEPAPWRLCCCCYKYGFIIRVNQTQRKNLLRKFLKIYHHLSAKSDQILYLDKLKLECSM